MSTIMSKINNIPNDSYLSKLCTKFCDIYGTPLNVESGPCDYDDIKKYTRIFCNMTAIRNASREEIEENKQYIRDITRIQFKRMRLVLDQSNRFLDRLDRRDIPHLLRPYCERYQDGTVRIVILVFFDNGQVALIKFDHNLSSKGQDMFYAFIFNNDAVQKNIVEYRATESKRIVAVTECAVAAAERMVAMSDTATATEYEMATLIVKRATHKAYSNALVANPPKPKSDGCENESGNECCGCECTCGEDNGCEDECAVCICGDGSDGCDGCNVEHCCKIGMCGYDLTQCNRMAHPNYCICHDMRLARNVNKYYEDATADVDAHNTMH
jgi:hypothetical protein